MTTEDGTEDERGPHGDAAHDRDDTTHDRDDTTHDRDDTTPDRGREHIELLRETIDRNQRRTGAWERYHEQYTFTVVDDGRVRLSSAATARETPTEGANRPKRAVETEVDHVVTVDGGVAVDCNCFMVRRRFTTESCRHMRAVDAHPFL